MVPLITLIVTFAVARALTGAWGHQDPGARSARAALAAMFFVTGVAHFVSTEAMVQMLPGFVPGALVIVYATGVLELAVGAFLLWRMALPTPWLGWALAGLFLALLPANIYSAIAEVGLGGHGPAYLWFRVPLQALFMGWALVATGALARKPAVAAA